VKHHQYFLEFETDNLQFRLFINNLPLVSAIGHQGLSRTLRVDRWLKPGSNTVTLQFDHIKPSVVENSNGEDQVLARGNLYSIDPDNLANGEAGNQDHHQSIRNTVARFKWTNNSRKIRLPFNDQFELEVDEYYGTNLCVNAAITSDLDLPQKQKIIRLVQKYIDTISQTVPTPDQISFYKISPADSHENSELDVLQSSVLTLTPEQKRRLIDLPKFTLANCRFYSGLDEKVICISTLPLEQLMIAYPSILKIMPICVAQIDGAWAILL